MTLQIPLADEPLSPFTPPAKSSLAKHVTKFASDLVQEAGAHRSRDSASPGNEPQVTSSMVDDAALLMRKGYRRPRRSRWLKAAQITAPLAALLAGLLADPDLLQQVGLLALFVVTASFALALTALVVLME